MKRCLVFLLPFTLAAYVLTLPPTSLRGQKKEKAAKSDDKDFVSSFAPPVPTSDWNKLFAWRSIGPANMGGRITSIAVFEPDPTCYYVATASGGLLKTTNNGSTFEHQFDRENTVSLGAVAVAATDRNLVWVGTGEANPRNSVSYGDGVYKSTDGGKSWKHMGLKNSFQIGKIVIHPKNPDIVYVAALGRLYGPNEERGVFKTADGGKTWEKSLYVDAGTGALDLVMDPHAPDTLIAALWERQRDAFDSFRGDARPPGGADGYAPAKVHGPGSGLFKTRDGGKTWQRLTAGLPKANMGRAGLDWHRTKPGLVYAIFDTDKVGMGQTVTKAFLGLSLAKSPEGLRVATLVKESPAAKAGLVKDDILVSLDDTPITSLVDLEKALAKRKPDDKATVEIVRGKERKKLDVTLGVDPDERVGTLGLGTEDADDGVMVTSVVEKGPADQAGIQPGDILVSLGDKKLDKAATFVAALKGRTAGEKVALRVSRGKESKTLDITLASPAIFAKGRPYGSRLGGQIANVQDKQGPDGNETGGVYRSTDGGESWTRVNSLVERPFYFTVVRIDPQNEKTIYVLGIQLYRSTDGGKTFTSDGLIKGVHVDFHDLWIDPRDSRHLILGSDGGIYVSYDRCAHWEHLNHLALGQYYDVAVDNRTPYRTYGGLQDNGTWGGPSQTLRPSGPSNHDYQLISGGDGFLCQVDPLDPDLIYSEMQDGVLFRRNLRTGQSGFLRPKIQAGTGPHRYNWRTPFMLSRHNPKIYYVAGNYVFRSVQEGDSLKTISPEISRTKRGSATALAESPRDADVLWVGTDDGAVWVTRDGGRQWTDVSSKLKAAGLPGPRWVASLDASRAATGRCYVCFDAHRSDDDEPYLFVTEDFGQTWKPLRGNLPTGSSRVLREDRINPNLLYCGTEFHLWVSLDRGVSWVRANGATLPTVAIHEIAQPTTANEIVAATHGRSLWVLDVTTLRQLKPEHVKPDTHLFTPRTVVRWRLDATQEGMFRTGTREFRGENPPRQAHIDYVLAKHSADVKLRIFDVLGQPVRELDVSKDRAAGFHRIAWDMTAGEVKQPPMKKGKGPAPGAQLPAGTYRVALEVDGKTFNERLVIEADPRRLDPLGRPTPEEILE
jgi:photosystem II stability/assembly factor-like uncharacterized protein